MSKSKKKVVNQDPFDESIGHFFKWYRAQRGLSQKDLANILDVSQVYVSKIENGLEEFPYNICIELFKHCDIAEKKYLYECMTAQLKKILSGRHD